MLIVGLTGGIGSGKSTIAKLFSQLNIPIYYTDDEAKKIMITSKIVQRKLIQKFGEEVYKKGVLNKAYLASLIFTDKVNLNYVNSIVHPRVNQHFKRWVKRQEKNTKGKYVIQENAILFENGSNVYCDYVIIVTAPKEIKVERVMKRDHTTKQKIEERMNNQWADSLKIEKSDFVIDNIGLEKTKKEVLIIHDNLIKLIKKR